MPVQRGILEPEIVQAPEYPLSEESLRKQALDYVKENRRKSYRQMKEDGELEEYLSLKVNACRRQAFNLIESGVWENEAWNMAIREKILETESD